MQDRPEIFIASWHPSPEAPPGGEGILLVCRPGGEVLQKADAGMEFPGWPADSPFPGEWPRMLIGDIDGRPVLLAVAPLDAAAPEGAEWNSPRHLLAGMDAARNEAMSRASMLASWDCDHRYCGRCGTATELDPKEAARVCPACAFRSYPRVSPAMITRITDGRRILLAHNARFPGGVYSCVAGYVEPGETLERTVVREVKEEVGLDASGVRYVKSQAWPLPHALMLGFEAHAVGDPVPDGVEITDAAWFDADNLPHIPRRGTIARYLIDDWLESLEA